MARILPRLENFPKEMPYSERILYKELQNQLSDEYTVYYSVSFLYQKKGKSSYQEGEADFIIFHPSKGLIVLEVKGGKISYQENQWYSKNSKKTYKIKDPFEQARNASHVFDDKIKNSVGDKIPYIRAYAVAFPQSTLPKQVTLPTSATLAIIIDESNLNGSNSLSLQNKIESIFQHYSKGTQTLDSKNAKLIRKKILEPEFRLIPSLQQTIESGNEQLLQITEQQYQILTLLENHPRACIQGSAGTGKTLLAIEKARRLVEKKKKTLLLCYTNQLANFLNTIIQSDFLTITTFHNFCFDTGERLGVPIIDPPQNDKNVQKFYMETAPNILLEALEKESIQYDALIIDEGQDFNEDWWIPLEELVNNAESELYIFYDDHQNVFDRKFSFPIEDKPFLLSINCRNTSEINSWVQSKFSFSPPSQESVPIGIKPELIPWKQYAHQTEPVKKIVTQLVEEEGASFDDIVLLTPFNPKKSILVQELAKDPKFESLNVQSIMGFKGMEANIVLLCDVGKCGFSSKKDLIYAGVTRAKLRLYIFHSHSYDFQQLQNEETVSSL